MECILIMLDLLLIGRAYFNQLLRAVPARSALFK